MSVNDLYIFGLSSGLAFGLAFWRISLLFGLTSRALSEI